MTITKPYWPSASGNHALRHGLHSPGAVGRLVVNMNMQRCVRCGVAKTPNDFHVDKRTGNRRGTCKECRQAIARMWIRSNRERVNAIKQRWYKAHQGRVRAVYREYERNNKEKRRAYSIVLRAKKRGIITQHPCSICGSLNARAHHPDYTKPLEVVWLCELHHSVVHERNKK